MKTFDEVPIGTKFNYDNQIVVKTGKSSTYNAVIFFSGTIISVPLDYEIDSIVSGVQYFWEDFEE